MFNIKIYPIMALGAIVLTIASCKVPALIQVEEHSHAPSAYHTSLDTVNSGSLPWRTFFTDKNLVSLIDTALKNNQELNITLQEIEIAKNEVRLKQGELMPSVSARLGLDVEKVGRYTSQGAGDASTEISPGKEMPDPLMDYALGAYAHWEVDIWEKLRNSKKAAITRYLATVEGKNFVLSNLISEIANSYYELQALDSELDLVKQNITLQKNALELVKVQKDASRVTELAVQKFSAEVLNSQSLEFDIQQNIKETENKINLLLGRYPQEIPRNEKSFITMEPAMVNAGIPSQLLVNRPDVKQAELALSAAKLDVKVARAQFYPSLGISAGLGLQAFKPSYLVKFPESMLYSLAGDLTAPLINRNAIKAEFSTANAKQLQALYNYERTLINAYLEVSIQLSKAANLAKKYSFKAQQVDALTKSISIANDLFKSARADYFEVLMTQRDALDSKLELIETKKEQLITTTSIYRNLGGGWK